MPGHEYSVKLRGRDGRMLLDCHSFASHAQALAAIVNVRALSPIASRYARRTEDTGVYTFDLVDFSARPVGTGAAHATLDERDEAIATCREVGPRARVVDEAADAGAFPVT